MVANIGYIDRLIRFVVGFALLALALGHPVAARSREAAPSAGFAVIDAAAMSLRPSAASRSP